MESQPLPEIAPRVPVSAWDFPAEALRQTCEFMATLPQSPDLMAWGLGAALVVLGASRKLLPGIWGWGADLAFNFLSTRAGKAADAKAYTLAETAERIIVAIEALPKSATIGELRRELKGITTADMRAAIEAVRADANRTAPPTPELPLLVPFTPNPEGPQG